MNSLVISIMSLFSKNLKSNFIFDRNTQNSGKDTKLKYKPI